MKVSRRLIKKMITCQVTPNDSYKIVKGQQGVVCIYCGGELGLIN
jgi:hypothetical protein